MSRKMIPLFLCLLGFAGLNTAYSQSFSDYIESTRGDTVVVKDYFDMSFVPNSLVDAIELDTNAPAGRVYELKRGGIYWVTRDLITPEDRPLVIAGEAMASLVVDSDFIEPPIFSGTSFEGTVNNGDIVQFRHDITLKNLVAMPAATDDSQGWTFFSGATSDRKLTLDNVLMEHTNWVFIQSNDFENNSVYISNSYFVNMSGEPCRRNGGIYDNVSNNTNEIVVENSTHVMAQGMAYKFRNFPINRAFFNHNTFVNVSGQLFTTFGYQSNFTLTNNLFINSNVQGYHPGLDVEETDQDRLPHGIVNVAHIPGDYNFPIVPDNQRKILVDRNGVYWDERLNTIVEVLLSGRSGLPGPPGARNGRNDWTTQMIKMNNRTQGIFDDNSRYPLIHESNWIMGGDPNFTDARDLMTDQVVELIEWSIHAAGAGPYESSRTLAKWRAPGNEAIGNYTYPDWPIPVDLSYSNEEYLTAGLGGLPLGDLNWFPAKKAEFDMKKAELYAELEAALNAGRTPEMDPTSIERTGNTIPSSIELAQNYPNPFNPTTVIEFSLNENALVKLEIFDVAGRLVTTLVNDMMSAGTYSATWNATNMSGAAVSSGVYMYRLQVGNQVRTRAMTLIK